MIGGPKKGKLRTRIRDLDLDHTILERLAIQSEGLLQTLRVDKLNITKAPGTLHLAILDDANADNLAAFEELGYGLIRSIIGEVAEMRSVRGLIREDLGEVLANRGEA